MKLVLFIFFLSSCANLVTSNDGPKEGHRTYAYVDASGRYVYTRETKVLKNKLITRTQISNSVGSNQKILEKSVMVTQLGSVKERESRSLVSRPFASDFTVWLEGKRYDSKFRLDPKTKSMLVDLNSPETKWQGKSSVPVPKGKLFCFFSQLPECLYHNHLLTRAKSKKGESSSFYIVWDGYPYIQEQISGIGMKLFAPAVLKYDGAHKSILRFVVEVGGQTVLYHFSKSYDLVRILWIAQGISIIPPGEGMNTVEE